MDMENEPRINVTRSSMPSLEEYIEEIKPIWENHWMTNMGIIYKELQHELKKYLEVPEISLFANGHMALEMAIDAIGLKNIKGGEVITTPFTFVSTTHAIMRNGLKPVFCDINFEDYTINANKIEELITPQTVAIIPVHVYGNICDVEKIQKIADRHNIKVIYDAAHAFGVKYKNIGIGNFGDASMFSFHATKVFNTIEGGGVTFKNELYKNPLHELKNFGIHGSEDTCAVGGNAKMDEFRAAMGVCNLRRMDECIASRKHVADIYNSRLGSIPGIKLNKSNHNATQNFSYYPIYVEPELFGKTRDDIYNELLKHNIFSRKYFYPAINETSCYKGVFEQNTPIAHDVSEKILTLPIYEGLNQEDVNRICDIICSLR